MDPDTGERFAWNNKEIGPALETMSKATVLIGHNIIRYDMPVLEKVCSFKSKARLLDTMVCARLIKSNIKDTDALLLKQKRLPVEFFGKHSIEAWGYRLGVMKLHVGIEDWSAWTPEIQERCVGDTELNLLLFKHLKIDSYSPQAIELENRIQVVCARIEESGWPFDMEAAQALHIKLVSEKARLGKMLEAEYGFWFAPKEANPAKREFIPKVNVKTTGYVKGQPCCKLKRVDFNAESTAHVVRALSKKGWIPEEFTEAGAPKVDESIIASLTERWPELKTLAEYITVGTRLGQLADGKQAWLKNVQPDMCIHGSINPMGTITGRASHFAPNLGQVPAVHSRKGGLTLYGRACRELFTVKPGFVMVGADMSGLELRCLAHYVAPMDGGEYGKLVCEGNVHTFNMQSAGLNSRDQAKTYIYALNYGAGDAKLGKIIQQGAKEGKRLREQTMKGFPAYAKLIEKIKANVNTSNTLVGLDKRVLPVRAAYAALNTLLQSAGAILCKEWVSSCYEHLIAKGFKYGWDGDFVILGWIHDEIQVAVRSGMEQEVQTLFVQLAREAGTPFGFRVPLDGASKTGPTWADTH